MLILGRQFGPLGPNDSIEFYGTGIDTPFSGTRVYWLVRGSRPGKRITEVPSPGRGAPSAQSFPFTVLFEQRTIYFAALLNGENNDNFFGATVTTDPVDQAITVAHIDPTSSLPVTMDVTLQGVTDAQAHSVSIAFNGAPVGEMDFANQSNVTNTFAISNSLLQNGANTVTLTALDGDNDVSLVQSIALHYAHTYTADSNWLRATASAGDTVRVNGFSSAQIHVLDITDPLAIAQLTGPVASDGSSFGITLMVPGSRGAERTLLAFSDDQTSAPAGLAFHAPNSLDRPQSGADMVVIAHPDFVASIAPLVKLHETAGHLRELGDDRSAIRRVQLRRTKPVCAAELLAACGHQLAYSSAGCSPGGRRVVRPAQLSRLWRERFCSHQADRNGCVQDGFRRLADRFQADRLRHDTHRAVAGQHAGGSGAGRLQDCGLRTRQRFGKLEPAGAGDRGPKYRRGLHDRGECRRRRTCRRRLR